MNDEDLLGYTLELLDPADRDAVASAVAQDAAAAARLAELRSMLAPLASDRADPEPRRGLAARTVARMAEYLVVNEPRTSEFAVPSGLANAPADRPEYRAVGGRFRFDLVVAGVLAVFVVGMVFTGISKLRQSSSDVACTNNLKTLYVGLSTYADTHNEQFPRIGPDQTADAFAISTSPGLPAGFIPTCPAETESNALVRTYTYTLGYRWGESDLIGLRRDANAIVNDNTPLAADNPMPNAAPCCGPVSPHPRGQNVLFISGNVRFTTKPEVGVNNDHIYQNHKGQMSAGLDRNDAVLGRAGTRP